MSRYFELLTKIIKRRNIPMCFSENEMIRDTSVLDFCIDELLVDELINNGTEDTDEIGDYVRFLEDAIDYYNKIRSLD